MKIVRTALTGPAASTFFAEFLMGDQSGTHEARDWEMHEDLLDLEKRTESDRSLQDNRLGHQPLTPCSKHLQAR